MSQIPTYEVDVYPHRFGGFIGRLFVVTGAKREFAGGVGSIEVASGNAGGMIFHQKEELLAYARREAGFLESAREKLGLIETVKLEVS